MQMVACRSVSLHARGHSALHLGRSSEKGGILQVVAPAHLFASMNMLCCKAMTQWRHRTKSSSTARFIENRLAGSSFMPGITRRDPAGQERDRLRAGARQSSMEDSGNCSNTGNASSARTSENTKRREKSTQNNWRFRGNLNNWRFRGRMERRNLS